MNIEFIEWMVGKCPEKQFRIYKKESKNTYGLMYVPEDDEDMYQSEFYKDGYGFKYGKTVYNILIQKTIECINDSELDYQIRSSEDGIRLYESCDLIADYWRFAEIDQAKEVALKYIYEQETK